MKVLRQAIVVLTALLACGSALPRLQAPTAARSRVVLTLDKNEFFLGENILVHYCFENTATDPITISYGGDYRGASRFLRFKVTVSDTAGVLMPDPDPSGFSLGGLGGTAQVTRGERWCQSLPLMRYARIDRAGTYEIRVVHDLGLPAGEAPEGRVTIRLAYPTDAQAEQVVVEMMSLSRDAATTMGRLSTPYADFSTLRYDVYLPALLRRAEAGDTTAVSALGSIPTPEATRSLVTMLGNANGATARMAARTLTARLPDPALDGALGPRNAFDNDMKSARRYLIDASWRAEFAVDVRAAAVRLLESADADAIQLGAFMLEAVGLPENAPALSTALTKAIEKTLTLPFETGTYPRPRGNVQELIRAADILVRRGFTSSEPGETPGGMALWLVAFGQGSRPASWQQHVSRALAHPIPYIRELAMDRLPADIPGDFVTAIAANLQSTDVDVVIAACSLANRGRLSTILDEVLNAFRKAKETWTVRTCGNAVSALGARFDYFDILASRLPEPDMTDLVLSMLLSVFDSDGSFSCCRVEQANILSVRWRSFLAAHRGDIELGRQISLDEADVTPDLAPGVTLHRTGKPDWPPRR